MNDILLTGIKPTGTSHLGNYLGAIMPAITLSKNETLKCFYFIADYHALTTVQDAKLLKQQSLEIACTWLACGLDPKQVIMYRQSDIPETFELSTILNNVTPKGLMNRAHAYKAMVEQNNQNKVDDDFGVNMGLYTYPILMAADILLFNANKVPVGLDQKQHCEIARDIAGYFNKKFGKTLVVPEPLIKSNVATIEGLDGRKMSKSYNNIIPIFCDEKTLEKKIMSIKTDSSLPDEPKDINCLLFRLYKLFASKEQIEEMEEKFNKGISWAEAKKCLFEVINKELSAKREKYNHYMTHPELVEEILQDGAKKAREISKETIARVRTAIGV